MHNVMVLFLLLQKKGYNKTMSILDNVDNNTYPLFEPEYTSLAVKIFSDTCCNGCSCMTENDHKPE